MKAINTAAGLALAAYIVLATAACSKTDNGSNDSAAAPTTQCTVSYDGTLRDQYGRSCNASNVGYSCAGYTYNAQTGTYINPANGQQIPASSCGGTNVIPNTGFGGNTYITSCQGWTQYYQSQGYNVIYVPVNIGGGTLICENFANLQPQIASSYYGYGSSPYQDPNYWYSNPPSAYDTTYYDQYGGGGSGWATNINLGYSSGGGFSAGINLYFGN